MVLPLMLYEVVGNSVLFVNLFIAGVIGGPHMYATFFQTLLDASFWQRHRLLVVGSLGIPGLVVAGAVWDFQLLMTLFFFWVSMHVLHQIAVVLSFLLIHYCHDHVLFTQFGDRVRQEEGAGERH